MIELVVEIFLATFCDLAFFDFFSFQAGQHALDHIEIAAAASVNNASLFEHRQKFRRARQRRVTRCDINAQTFENVHPLLVLRAERFRCFAHNRQDGAFHRIAHCFVRRLHTAVESGDQRCRVDGLAACETFCKASEDLRKDHAGVAARTHNSAKGSLAGVFSHARRFRLADEFRRRLHGHRHVRSRIAVRHREHIQLVHALLV